MTLSALGIHIGDIITTSYGTGPYVVTSIHGPHYVQRTIWGLCVTVHPEISVGLRCLKTDKDGFIINNIRRLPAGRWMSRGDTIYVESVGVKSDHQGQLFDALTPAPYEFQAGVDYQQTAWKCGNCGCDFNAPALDIPHPALPCPRCLSQWQSIPIYVITYPEDITEGVYR